MSDKAILSIPLALFLLLISIFTLSAVEEKRIYESETIVSQGECLQLMSWHRVGGGTWNIKFYNACPEKVYANVCVEERPGRFKLHKSGVKIPQYGYFDIYSYEGTSPLSVDWRSSTGSPGIPGQCGIEAR